MYGHDDGGFERRETDNFSTGRTGIAHGWTVNNMLRGDEEPGHFEEDLEPDQNDEVLCCPNCERPNQFGELCFQCQRERDRSGRALRTRHGDRRMSILKFEPNTTVQVALRFPTGKHVPNKFNPDEEQVMFSLVGGQVMYVPVIVEKQLQELNPKRGDQFEICKAQENGKTEWKVSRPVTARKPQAAATLLDGASLDGPDADPVLQTRLEFALKTALQAAKAAEEFSEQIGHPVRFDKDDVRAMANVLLMGQRGQAA